MKVQKY